MTEVIVTVQQGRLRGKSQTSIKGRTFLSFLGIPYAKPPVGKLRFKDPEPPESWDGIRDATVQGAICHGRHIIPTLEGIKLEVTGSEDCLFLNIFTHKLVETQKDLSRPVMVWIHGGAFTSGSSDINLYGPDLLLTEDVVLVTINYRLGALGYLSIEDQLIGNAGSKDMIQALKWIQKNIGPFGGDPTCVTIFGESAGGAAVHYLVLSPLAKGLFHRAIAQSGDVLSCWARGQQNNGFQLAHVLGCTEKDPEKVLEFLQSLPADKILEGQLALGDFFDASKIRYFSPTVEKKSPNAFISEDPIKLIQSGNYNHVPFIIGYTSLEGMVLPILDNIGLNVTRKDFVPFVLGYDKDSNIYKETNKKIIQHYFGNEDIDKNLIALMTIGTDVYFVRGIQSSVKAHTKTSSQPVFLYKITLETKLNTMKNMLKITQPGVSHADELGYIFKTFGTPELEPGSPEDIGVRRFVKLWTNFARTGNPIPSTDSLLNVEWKPAEEGKLNYLEIGNDLVSGVNPDGERLKFWDTIFEAIPEPY